MVGGRDVPEGVDGVEIRTGKHDDFAAILAMQKTSKETVGFIPDQAVRDRLERGTILVAEWDDGRIVGYLMYDLPRNEVSIKHLVTDPWTRLGGVAEQLVERLVSLVHGQRQWIGLKCRRDYELRKFWERVGFTPYGEVAGRAKDGSVLTLWRRELGYPDLFGAAAEQDPRPLAVLDTNLVIKGAAGDTAVGDRLLAEWVHADVRFGVAAHTYTEIDRRDVRADRERNKRYADGIGRVAGEPGLALRIEAEIRSVLGTAAEPHLEDITIAAQAASAGARWMVTEDHRFRRACGDVIAKVAEVELVSIAGLLVEVNSLAAGDGYRPVELMGTDVSVQAVESGDFDELARRFLNQRAGETFNEFRSRLHALASAVPETHLSVFVGDGELLALVAVRSGEVLEAPVCRVRHGAFEPTLARQVLGWLRDQVVTNGAVAIRLTDRASGRWVGAGLVGEGFLDAETPIAVPVVGSGSIVDLSARLELEPLASLIGHDQIDRVRALPDDEASAHLVERTFDPFTVLGAGLRTYRVPIGERYASELFDHSLSEGQLFARDRGLALRREHVYFRDPGGGIEAPARILWHVTGDGSGGRKMRAVSLLNEVVVGDVDQIIRRFAPLGVLDPEQVKGRAKNGRIMALRFSHTSLFPSPVTLDQYVEVMAELTPDDHPIWVSPQAVTEQVFDRVITMAR
jgi:predicted nucleic acid-binding protein